jgi:hypothetical protein
MRKDSDEGDLEGEDDGRSSANVGRFWTSDMQNLLVREPQGIGGRDRIRGQEAYIV